MALGKRKPFHTPHRKRRIFWHRITIGATTMIILTCVYALVFYGVRTPFLQVDGVIVRGLETVPETLVRERANTLLAGAYFGFVPRRFKPFAPAEEIQETIEQLPRVALATVTTEGSTLVVTVAEHVPDMLWCETASATSSCVYVDKRGVAYERAPMLDGSSLMRFVSPGTPPVVGSSLLDDRIRTLLIDIARILDERHDFRVSRIEYGQSGDASLFLVKGGVVMMSTAGDLTSTYANLASVFEVEEYAHLKPGQFEYIDMRFGNKVFVQKEKPVATTSASTTSVAE
jgi:cell division septal protein FtsQ